MDWHYFAGIDPTHGGVGRTRLDRQRSAADDFAITTARAKVDGPIEFVKIQRFSGVTADQQSAIVHQEYQAFVHTYLVMDPSGGGLHVRDKLREPVQSTGAGDFVVDPLITVDDDQLAGVGIPRLVLFGRSDSRITGKNNDPSVPGIELVLTSESVLPNKMHEIFRGALQTEPMGVHFPGRWEGWPAGGGMFTNPDMMRGWLNEQPGLGGRDKIAAEFDLALFQLSQVNRKMDADGRTPLMDKSGNFTFGSIYKKDSAYSMVYAFFGAWIWRCEERIHGRKEKPKPKFIASSQEL